MHRGDESENASYTFRTFSFFSRTPPARPPSFSFPFWGMGRIRFPFAAAAAGDLVMEKIALRSACAPPLRSRRQYVTPSPPRLCLGTPPPSCAFVQFLRCRRPPPMLVCPGEQGRSECREERRGRKGGRIGGPTVPCPASTLSSRI